MQSFEFELNYLDDEFEDEPTMKVLELASVEVEKTIAHRFEEEFLRRDGQFSSKDVQEDRVVYFLNLRTQEPKVSAALVALCKESWRFA